jgi:hypothetical protein
MLPSISPSLPSSSWLDPPLSTPCAQRVHRPQAAGGELALLRASCGHSTDLAKRRLERWGWTIRALGAVSTLGLLVGAAVASAVKRRLWVALMCLGVAAAVAATTGWWLSMMVGAALVQTPVDRVRAQVQ